MKQCTKCKEWKDEAEYTRRCDVKDGLSSWCKRCVNIKIRKHRQQPEVKSRIKDWNREYHQKPEVKLRLKEHRRKPEVRARRAKLRNRPSAKLREKEYYERPEVKAKRKEYVREYDKRPEVKLKNKVRLKAYCQKPEYKAKNNRRGRMDRANLADSYVKRLLRASVKPTGTITNEMIAIKRGLLIWFREINNNKEVLKNGINPK